MVLRTRFSKLMILAAAATVRIQRPALWSTLLYTVWTNLFIGGRAEGPCDCRAGSGAPGPPSFCQAKVDRSLGTAAIVAGDPPLRALAHVASRKEFCSTLRAQRYAVSKLGTPRETVSRFGLFSSRGRRQCFRPQHKPRRLQKQGLAEGVVSRMGVSLLGGGPMASSICQVQGQARSPPGPTTSDKAATSLDRISRLEGFQDNLL